MTTWLQAIKCRFKRHGKHWPPDERRFKRRRGPTQGWQIPYRLN